MKLLPLLLGSLTLVAASHAEKPNVLLIIVDDMGYTDTGFGGSRFHDTPSIDQLSINGASFTDAYSAHPVCSPTRAAIMAGKSPQRVGITQWISSKSVFLSPSEVTIAEALREQGYSTGFVGKWHLGELPEHRPDKQGFDWIRAVAKAGRPSSYFAPYTGSDSSYNIPDLQNDKEGKYLTDSLTDLAIEFMSQKRNKPFFLCLSHYAVHTPIEAPEPLVSAYMKKAKTIFKNPNTPLLEQRYGSVSRGRQDDPEYAAMVENLDTNLGRLMSYLETNNKLNNTIVIFTSDNGGLSTLPKEPGPTSNIPFRAGKGWNYEGGTRIPTIISWKGKITPRKVATPFISTDLYPTILELAGLPQKPEQHLDGTSLTAAIYGKDTKQLDNRLIGWSYPHKHGSGHKPSNAIRVGEWKLIRFEQGNRFELYNLKQDPSESHDLSHKNSKKVLEMDAQMTKWLKDTQVPD